MSKTRSATIAAFVIVAGTRAMAQEVPPVPTTVGTSAKIDEIVVTAQRRSENLQRVPIAVTAISSAQLAAANIQSTAGLSAVTPSLTFADANGFLAPRIRGIGNSAAGPGVENSTATYVDGVYLASAPATLLALAGVSRIEVLKGPQGTLFGRNATSGLIQIITKTPASTFQGSADIGYGNYDSLRANAYLTGPLANGVAADLAVSAGHQGDGYGTNVTTGNDIYKTKRDIAVRAKVKAAIDADTTATLSADYSNSYSSDPAFAPEIGSKPLFGKGKFFPSNRWDTATDTDPFHTTEGGGASLNLEHQFGAAVLTSTTAYRAMRFHTVFDGDISPTPFVITDYVQKDRQFSQELQLASRGSERLKWVAGLFYFDLNSRYDPYTLLQGLPAARSQSISYQDSLTRSYAGYGQISFEILPNTTLTGGLRYTRDERSLDGTVRSITPAGVSKTAVNAGSTAYNTPTWRASVDHRFTPELLTYLSYNRGYKSGGYNAQAPTAPSYVPEQLDAYEAGVKSITFGDRLRLNGAAFYYKYRNIQVNTFIGTQGVIYNGASAENYGLDFDFDLVLSGRLKFNGGIVALHDRFTSFPLAVVGTVFPDGSATLAPGSATGNRLPFAPDLTGDLGFNYTVPMSSGSAVLAVNDLYSSGFYAQPDNILHQPAYHLLGASLTWKSRNEAIWVRAWANNLLNKDVIVSDVISSVAQIKSLQPPRTFGVVVGTEF